MVDDGEEFEDVPPDVRIDELPEVHKGRGVPFDDLHKAVVTYWLLGLVSICLCVAAAAVFVGGDAWDRMKDYLAFVFGPLIGVTGTIIGYYFGRQS